MKSSRIPNSALIHFICSWNLVPILIVSIMVFNAFSNSLIPRQETIDTKKISILDTLRVLNSDTIMVTKKEIVDHNAMIISTLNEWMSIDGNQNATRESIKMQIRLFYVAIFAALIAFLFRKNGESKSKVRIYLLFLILLIYAIEVHFNDMSYRRTDSYMVKANAVNLLLESHQADVVWFKINYKKFEEAWDTASSPNERWVRKFLISIKPDIEQIMLYLSPFIWLLYDRFSDRRKKNLRTYIV